jgi:hypothetical protein
MKKMNLTLGPGEVRLNGHTYIFGKATLVIDLEPSSEQIGGDRPIAIVTAQALRWELESK